MANKTIADYTAAITIDAANDFLLIEPSGNTVYRKINRNILLGLSSAPLGTTDSQSPTNKTFDNTNTMTIKDTNFTLQDDGDATKQVKFQLSGITTGNTRTLTVPNASVTLASLTGTETLTNKTITSPTITGGTIDNTTITVDSIAGHTSSTIVTVANLQISNGVLNSANAVTATSIAAGAVQPQALVTGTGSGWAWSTWSPVWTNVSVGNGTVTAKYIQTGKTVTCRLNLVLGGTTTVTGSIIFTLPVTATNYGASGTESIVLGWAWFEDNGVGNALGVVALSSTTTGTLFAATAGSTYVTAAATSGSVPVGVATGDSFNTTFTYEAA